LYDTQIQCREKGQLPGEEAFPTTPTDTQKEPNQSLKHQLTQLESSLEDRIRRRQSIAILPSQIPSFYRESSYIKSKRAPTFFHSNAHPGNEVVVPLVCSL